MWGLLIAAAAFAEPPHGVGMGRPSAYRPAAYGAKCTAIQSNSDALLDAASAIKSIWTLPCTQDHRRRTTVAHRETRENTHAILWGEREWAEHTRCDRYMRIVLTWPWSRLAHTLMPALLEIALWSAFAWRFQLKLTANAVGFLISPIALLLAFRVNSVVSRFHEARALWANMICTARNMASMLTASDEDEMPASERARCGRYLIAYAWCAKAFTRFEQNPAPLLHALLPPHEAERAAAARKPALAVVSLLRQATQGRPLKAHVSRGVHEGVNELNRLYGGLERLVSTPLSPTYARHTQRGLLMWLHMLPCGLISAGCTSARYLVPVVLAVAYIMLAIDEISVQIDQPFDVLPVQSLASALTHDVTEELFSYQRSDVTDAAVEAQLE